MNKIKIPKSICTCSICGEQLEILDVEIRKDDLGNITEYRLVIDCSELDKDEEGLHYTKNNSINWDEIHSYVLNWYKIKMIQEKLRNLTLDELEYLYQHLPSLQEENVNVQ